MIERRDIERTGARIEKLLDEVHQAATPIVIERVEELVHRVVDLYGAGLERVLACIDESDGTVADVRRALLADPLVSSLLAVHELRPRDVAAAKKEESQLIQLRRGPGKPIANPPEIRGDREIAGAAR